MFAKCLLIIEALPIAVEEICFLKQKQKNSMKTTTKKETNFRNHKTGTGKTNLKDFAASRISFMYTSFGKIWKNEISSSMYLKNPEYSAHKKFESSTNSFKRCTGC